MSSSSAQARDPGSWAESLGLYTGLLLQSSGERRTHRGTDHRQLESSSRLKTQDGLHGARGHMPRRVAALHLPGKSLLEATTSKNRLQVSWNRQAPHRTPTSPSLSQSGAGRGAGDEMRLELKGCSGAHTPAHGPQQPHPELGAPLKSPCAPSCSPLPKLAG